MTPQATTNCLIGGALGDALGLPAEGLRASRIARMWPGPWKHRFVFGHGMVSDDTEHAVMTAWSLAETHGNPDAFARAFARRLRWWFAGVPAGIGLATARSILRLWIGFHPGRSGVFSAGNGPLMRAPIIGLWFRDDPISLQSHVEASTRITHTDPRASEAARIISKAAAWASVEGGEVDELLTRIAAEIESAEMKHRFSLLKEGLERGLEVSAFADSFGRKHGFVSGFAPDTAIVALYAWLRHRGDFRKIVTSVVTAGGDTDTVAFVAGSLAGIEAKDGDFPEEWLSGLRDFPIRPGTLRSEPTPPPFRYPNLPFSLIRNAMFFLIVLGHAFRRILPPY